MLDVLNIFVYGFCGGMGVICALTLVVFLLIKNIQVSYYDSEYWWNNGKRPR